MVSHDDLVAHLAKLPHRISGDSYSQLYLFAPKAEICRIVKPRTVFEFGAYHGLFLVSALYGHPGIEELGWIDNELYLEGSNEMAAANVRSVNPDVKLWWRHDDHCSAPGFGQADLVHVDSDHSFHGCLRDLAFALLMDPKVILVDDHIPAHAPVERAVAAFCEWQELDYFVVDTANGCAVIDRVGGLKQKLRRRNIPIRP
jgi:hypothetical protein